MKFKKMLCGLAALATMFSACVVPVSAAEFQLSQNHDFLDSYDIYFEDEEKSMYYYFVYYNECEGEYYAFDNKYDYVFITSEETTDIQKICDVLGDEVDTQMACLQLDENQHAFRYADDVEYESLYEIDGIEKVSLANMIGGSPFFNSWTTFCPEDTWWQESTIKSDNLIQISVTTAPETILTEEMFSNTGYNVVHVYKSEETSDSANWFVYYEKTGERASCIDFIDKAKQIDNIISADIPSMSFLCIARVNYYDLTDIADLIGDANGDGIVNIADLILMKKYLLESVSADMLDISKSDLNNDGDLSAYDYISIKKRMIK